MTLVSKRPIYVDNSATTPLSNAALAAMTPYFQAEFGNPSAIYSYGLTAHKALEDSRKQVAKCLGALSSEIFFCSGGTESDNWALFSVAERYWGQKAEIIVTAIEHNAVLKPLEKLENFGFTVKRLKPDKRGLIDPDQLAAALTDKTVLVSIALANNVVGTIQDIKALVKVAKAKKVLFHTDAVQAAGYLPINVRDLDVDFLSISGHKFHGPKGVGVLFAKVPHRPEPLIAGGGQEKGARSGTENIPGVVGLATALKEATESFGQMGELRALRDQLIAGILEIKGASLTGDPLKRLPGLASFVFSDFTSSVYLINLLNEMGVCASSGSACSAASREASHVLSAMGYAPEIAQSSLRFSLSRLNSASEVKIIVEKTTEAVKVLRTKPTVSRLKKGGRSRPYAGLF
ncbi:MAG: cysteine desulfurase [Deltaproteobacteria bacterium]|jgi:cysteine desulfurase|nr:cysteine desulfurase [Deltaproteobacteria bacterium]